MSDVSDTQPSRPRRGNHFSNPFGIIAAVITAVVVGSSSLLVLSQLRPDLLLMNSTTAGGDMGAHTWAPKYLVDHLLPHGRITGWTPDWYAGFPALHFYFPLPMITIALLDVVMPGNVAFKLVTVSGLVLLPVAVWAGARIARLPFPVPVCLAAFTLPFLFSDGFNILGGNMASALAGEFAFSFALAIAMVFLGVVANGMQTGRHRAAASLLFGAVILSHVLPTIFAFVGGTLMVLMATVNAIGKGRAAVLAPLKWATPVAITGTLLSIWWLGPFVLRDGYMNDMGWEKIGTGTEAGLKLFEAKIVTYADALFPFAERDQNGAAAVLFGMMFIAVISAAIALFFRRPAGIFLLLIGAVAAIGFIEMPQGRLWNARLLPFWYLSIYMLAGLLVGEIGHGLVQAIKKFKTNEATIDVTDGLKLTAPLVALVITFAVVLPDIPGPRWWPAGAAPFHDARKSGGSFVPGWAEWNYAGYEGKKECNALGHVFGGKGDCDGGYYKPAYPEYKSVLDMLRSAGLSNGCGRVMWEYEPELDRFGTPMALMLSPNHTNGCMGSMEGLYFESSATVPYHFLNQREMSNVPSSPMRDIPYAPGLDVSGGVTKMQLMGVKYYLAVTPEAQQQAAIDTRLKLIASVPAADSKTGQSRTWNLYDIADSEIVAPLTTLPNVLTQPESIQTWRTDSANQANGRPLKHDKHSPREAWLENTLAWYANPQDFDTPLAADGPSNWPRINTALDPVQKISVEPATVTYIATGDDRISFHVDKVGVPVVVKASYFPNWEVKGADAVYRVTPNQMVVVPTSNDVTLHYGRTSIDIGAAGLTGVGFLFTGLMWRADRRHSEESTVEQQHGLISE